MFYPTVLLEKPGVRCVVKDKNYCMCGSKYKAYSTFLKADFKRIEFKQRADITCPNCQSIIN
ncbi:hypothetical protein [Bacillus sp. B1-b2]|uniref:hypothetical protein n=1 Tax=Bacillus sp. B1-b2 TaxID=2653201 RepID=UPI00126246C1|nr:hypothetical protein [Bacillus sp. B1-b2]KAB7672017.1 hypothetical protein F9279_03585 [Bacillus sp. B1-b2]